MSDRPRTVEQIAALPEAGFGAEDRVINGKTVRVPVAPDLMVFWSEDTDVLSYVDRKGNGWRLARYADGRWCRIRS